MMGCVRALDSGVLSFEKFRELIAGADISEFEKLLSLVFEPSKRRQPLLVEK